MATNFYCRTSLIGGGAGSVDEIDGAGLADLDAAFVQVFGTFYPYTLDDDSGAAESSPLIISPDTNPGTKRWLLQDISVNKLVSNVATGTAPLTVSSTTKVANLNADLLDDQEGSYYLDSANFTGTNWTDLTDAGATTLHKHDHGGMDGLADNDHTQYVNAVSDTSTINLTLTGQSISGVTIDSAINHDALLNFVGNEHIDHTSVTLTAGTGLTGGGDISANRTFNVDLSSVQHDTLAGLTDDDHTQYALLAGRSGGQSLTGGTASGEDLTLESTSNATKGSIFLGSNSEFNGAENRLSLNGLSPTYKIEAHSYNTNNLFLLSGFADSAPGVGINFRKGRGSLGSEAVLQDNDTMGVVRGQALTTAPSTYTTLTNIKMAIAESGGSYGGNIALRCASVGGAVSSILTVHETQRVFISSADSDASDPVATLQVEQGGTAEAVPVLQLDQSDVSEEFIKFIGTSLTGNGLTNSLVDDGGSDTIGGTTMTMTIQGYLRIYVQDDGNFLTDQAYYIPFGTLA